MTIKFTIIIPIYNVEKYLPKCLDSVVNQTYQNIEIICINDGSSDNSLLILQQYALKDKRIVLINQENKGVSVARNIGLEKSIGEYVLFVDADDWIELETCEYLDSILTTNPQDLIVFNYNVITKKVKRKVDNTPQKMAFWASCYKNKIIKINNIKFPENIKMSEDQFFKFNFLHYAKDIKYTKKAFYNYNLINENSATKNFEKVITGEIEAYNLLKQTDFYKNSTREKQLELTDYWGVLLFSAWSSIPFKLIKSDYTLKIVSFLENYKQFKDCNYEKLIGYKRLKYKWLLKILKSIRDFFLNINI